MLVGGLAGNLLDRGLIKFQQLDTAAGEVIKLPAFTYNCDNCGSRRLLLQSSESNTGLNVFLLKNNRKTFNYFVKVVKSVHKGGQAWLG